MKKLIAMLLCLTMCLGMLAVTASAAGDTYVVAGVAELCGSGWDTGDMNNAMTKASDGTYSKTYYNVPAGEYKFKVVKNQDWSTSWPGSDYVLTLDAAQDVTIVFDPATQTVSIAGKADTYVVAGSSALCNGEEWNGSSTVNVMTENNGVYTLVLNNVAPGSYQYKIVKNGSTWIGDSNGNNFELTVSSACNVTITYNSANGSVTATGSGIGENAAPTIEYMAVVGSGTADLNDWNGEVVMTSTEENVYVYTFENLTDATMSIKFRANGNWSYNFGGSYVDSGVEADAAWDGGNINFGVTGTANVTVELDLTGFDYSTKSGATFTVTITPVASSGDEGDDTTTGGDTTTDDDATTGSDATTGGDTTTPEAETITVYAKVPSDWTSVSAYIWDGNGTDNTWPGATMTKTDSGWYKVELPVWGKNIIIDNGGNGCQTQDIAIESGKDLWITVEADGYGFTGTVAYEAPRTGDATNLIALCTAMLLAGAAVITTVGSKKKFF